MWNYILIGSIILLAINPFIAPILAKWIVDIEMRKIERLIGRE